MDTNLDLALAKRWITHWEGCRTHCYKDVRGIPTIGVGLNLQDSSARAAITKLGLNPAALTGGSVNLTSEQIDVLLSISLASATATARDLIRNFDQIPAQQQLVLIDLAFNMGQSTLAKFQNTLYLIEQQNWHAAAESLRHSAWFHEVGPLPTQRGGADVSVLSGTRTPASILGLSPDLAANLGDILSLRPSHPPLH